MPYSLSYLFRPRFLPVTTTLPRYFVPAIRFSRRIPEISCGSGGEHVLCEAERETERDRVGQKAKTMKPGQQTLELAISSAKRRKVSRFGPEYLDSRVRRACLLFSSEWIRMIDRVYRGRKHRCSSSYQNRERRLLCINEQSKSLKVIQVDSYRRIVGPVSSSLYRNESVKDSVKEVSRAEKRQV